MNCAIDSGCANPISLGASASKNARANVLVVDDDEHIRAACTAMLNQAGFAVTEAEDGALAWKALLSVHYHLLITDHLMPRVSGLLLIRRMRAAGMIQPVILMSGTLHFEKQISDPWCRIDATLPKPFSSNQLLIRVYSVLDLAPREMAEARSFTG
jgi:DNA-binding response OmpR family regulator